MLLQLKNIHARLKSWDGGMLQTPLLTVPALVPPGPLTAPQSCCRAAKLKERGTTTGAVTILRKGAS